MRARAASPPSLPPETTDASDAYRNTGQPLSLLEGEAYAWQQRFVRIGGWFGAWVGVVLSALRDLVGPAVERVRFAAVFTAHPTFGMARQLCHALADLASGGKAGEAVVALGGSHGTLSEIAFALQFGKTVIGIRTWKIEGVREADDAAAALRALDALFKRPSR